MKRKTINCRLTLFSCCLYLLTSCEFWTGVSGKVIDKETGKPISGATVDLLEGENITKSNKDGYFEVNGHRRSYKVDPSLVISKNGFKPFQIRISNSDDEKIYSIKTETKWIKYPDTLFLNSKKTSFILGFDYEKWSQDFTNGDTLIIYLTKDNKSLEIEKSKRIQFY